MPSKEFFDILAEFLGKGVGSFQGLRTTKKYTKSRPLTVRRTSLESMITNKRTHSRLWGLGVWFSLLELRPNGVWPPHSWGFEITHNEAPQLVVLLWTSDQLDAETSTWQNTILTTDKHPCSGGIRTHNLSRTTVADLRLRQRGQWNRPMFGYTAIFMWKYKSNHCIRTCHKPSWNMCM